LHLTYIAFNDAGHGQWKINAVAAQIPYIIRELQRHHALNFYLTKAKSRLNTDMQTNRRDGESNVFISTHSPF